MKWTFRIGLALLGAVVVFAYFNNASWLAAPPAGRPLLLAHRGLAQTFALDGVQADTCTASRIHPPEHPFLENTLASMRAAFEAGADVVELDIHPTTDGQFAVFHDWTLDCRTDGTGRTRDHRLADLKALDVGYGYTADGGKTFPFRGHGVGAMPSLDDVLGAFPERRFLIHIKSNEPADGEKLAERLARLPAAQRNRLMVYGGARPVDAVNARLQLPTTSGRHMQSCLLRYIAVGWTGHVPQACAGSIVLVPINIAPWLWGWPDRFLARMRESGSIVFALGPWEGDGFSSGIDTTEEFRRLPVDYAGGIWTNRIDRIAALARRREASSDGEAARR
jgi:glycerophosphoryl diester phosphodiesterase